MNSRPFPFPAAASISGEALPGPQHSLGPHAKQHRRILEQEVKLEKRKIKLLEKEEKLWKKNEKLKKREDKLLEKKQRLDMPTA